MTDDLAVARTRVVAAAASPQLDTRKALLALLVTDRTQDAIGRRLHVSQRTIEARVARLKVELGATTLYTLGMLAVRHMYVEQRVVLRYAEQHGAPGSAAARPTGHQGAVLHLLATGSTCGQAASRLGLSERTVRRQVKRLAEANGVRELISAGALFEILGWHRAPIHPSWTPLDVAAPRLGDLG